MQGSLLINTNNNSIDISSLANGIYIMYINGQTHKIVKQ